jgi:hypothetical protein
MTTGGVTGGSGAEGGGVAGAASSDRLELYFSVMTVTEADAGEAGARNALHIISSVAMARKALLIYMFTSL